MKRLLGTVLVLLLLTACGPGDNAAPPAVPTSAPAQNQAADPAPTATPAADAVLAPDLPPDVLVPLEGPALDYDEIRPIVQEGLDPPDTVSGYYTVCQNGLWGLIRADGAEVLPCKAAAPVRRCELGHWMWWDAQPDMGGEWEQTDAALRQSGDGSLEPGHGGWSGQFFFDLTRGEPCLYSGMDGLFRIAPAGTPNLLPAARAGRLDPANALLPLADCYEQADEFVGIVPGETESGLYYYDTAAGVKVPVQAEEPVTAAGFFYDEALAPVRPGKGNWAYIDRGGVPVTAAVYAPVYNEAYTYNDDLGDWQAGEPTMAAPLRGGYAAVCRADTGGWGLLDAGGTEIVPAVYAGCAWDGTVLWLRLESQSPWQAYMPAA